MVNRKMPRSEKIFTWSPPKLNTPALQRTSASSTFSNTSTRNIWPISKYMTKASTGKPAMKKYWKVFPNASAQRSTPLAMPLRATKDCQTKVMRIISRESLYGIFEDVLLKNPLSFQNFSFQRDMKIWLVPLLVCLFSLSLRGQSETKE